jgi:hypothetical protein
MINVLQKDHKSYIKIQYYLMSGIFVLSFRVYQEIKANSLLILFKPESNVLETHLKKQNLTFDSHLKAVNP